MDSEVNGETVLLSQQGCDVSTQKTLCEAS